MVTYDYNLKIPADQAGINRLEAKLQEMTSARIKLLDTYANDKDMQNNAEIRNGIGYLAEGVQTMEECDFIIDVLSDKEGKYKATKENFGKTKFRYNLYDILSHYIRERNIPISLISRILKNPVIEDSVRHETIHDILKQDKSNLDKLNIVFDLMQKKPDVVKSKYIFDYNILRYAFFKTNDPVGYITEALGC